MWCRFPSDPATYDIDSQFLLGPAVMVMPALYQGQTQVEAYFPAGLWYDFESQKVIASTAERVTLDAPIDHINIAIRGGHILPCQVANLTTTSREQLE
ncbi:GAA [Cordylochernes scorpioides]|uniref:GAA n=1 Tax=Cordylochernes scorpioides TaxID=51811 RepID=A0ABY6KMR9_9ARAC|nr:GAA [Cordylochernes scorpioides]